MFYVYTYLHFLTPECWTNPDYFFYNSIFLDNLVIGIYGYYYFYLYSKEEKNKANQDEARRREIIYISARDRPTERPASGERPNTYHHMPIHAATFYVFLSCDTRQFCKRFSCPVVNSPDDDDDEIIWSIVPAAPLHTPAARQHTPESKRKD